ncbi:helix-turn-helix domain-containing protein [Synechococcus sp. PCC 7336]|uniref:helix-turn-helix domain-containing protein n=1 Tax=Synechococcus sp. PCC 7336 TaxID=195250 RepID=UPI00034625C4|nr:helix-turn-helix transcriptional regulator [Synechococcus sp. PCC 7336]
MAKHIEVEVSSGNVFADLELPDADELLFKAQIVARICDLIEARNLTQQQAAESLGTQQPKVSELMRGRLDGFSTDRLFRFLNALDQDVEIVIKQKPHANSVAGVHVS